MALPGDYIKACGDLYAGSLLYRMVYLWEKTNIVHDGVKWYVQTRNQTLPEVGLSEYAYKKGIGILKELQFIETVAASKIGVLKYGLTATAFRVTDAALEAVLQVEQARKSPNKAGVPSPNKLGDSHPTSGATIAHHYKKEESLKNVDKTSLSDSKADQKKSSAEFAVKKDSQGEGGDGIAKCVPPIYDPAKPLTTYDLEKVFREAFHSFDPKYFHVTWGSRMRGIAKVFVKQVGDKRVIGVMHHCIVNWSAFREFAQSGTSLHIPERPDMLALSTHAAAAVTWIEHGAVDCNGPAKSGWAMKKVGDFK